MCNSWEMLTAQQHMNAPYIMMLTVEIAGLFKTGIKFNWGKKINWATIESKTPGCRLWLFVISHMTNLEVYTYEQYTSAQMRR